MLQAYFTVTSTGQAEGAGRQDQIERTLTSGREIWILCVEQLGPLKALRHGSDPERDANAGCMCVLARVS